MLTVNLLLLASGVGLLIARRAVPLNNVLDFHIDGRISYERARRGIHSLLLRSLGDPWPVSHLKPCNFAAHLFCTVGGNCVSLGDANTRTWC